MRQKEALRIVNKNIVVRAVTHRGNGFQGFGFQDASGKPFFLFAFMELLDDGGCGSHDGFGLTLALGHNTLLHFDKAENANRAHAEEHGYDNEEQALADFQIAEHRGFSGKLIRAGFWIEKREVDSAVNYNGVKSKSNSGL